MSASSLAEPLPVAVPGESEKADAPRWKLATLVSFRFAFTFLMLFFFPFPLNFVPFINDAAQNVWDGFAIAVGKAVFGVTVNPAPTGSGDKIADWVTLFAIAVVSAAVTLIWSVLDRKAA